MKFSKVIPCLLLGSVLSFTGCLTVAKAVPPGTALTPQKAYIGGYFDLKKEGRIMDTIAIMVMNTQTKQEIALKCFPSEWQKLRICEVEPGTYRVTRWVTTNATNETIFTKPFTSEETPYARDFTVAPGTVAYIGDVTSAVSLPGFGQIRYEIREIKDNLPEYSKRIQEGFKDSANLSFVSVMGQE